MAPIIDFRRSFLTFRIDTLVKPPATASHEPPYSLNNARIQIECRCRIIDLKTGDVQTFIMGASCKTERVGVERDIWTEPNADFIPIFSGHHFMHIKTYASAGVDVDLYPHGSGRQSDRQTGTTDDAFDNLRIDIVECSGFAMTSAKEIVTATLANHPLSARTTIESERFAAIIEYPIKTINANERDMIYQTDTGPVLLPDLDCTADSMLTRLELAYSAFNCVDWTEFIVRAPTSIGDNINVYHYSKPVRLDCKNQVFRIV